jgi:hypothetical protein
LSIKENRELAVRYLEQVTGAVVKVDQDGFVTLGEQRKQGVDWKEARGRVQEIISDRRVVGISGNTNRANVWGFDTRTEAKDPNLRFWAKGNRLDAWISIWKTGYFSTYQYRNPRYRGFWKELRAGASRNPEKLQAEFTTGDHFAHEALGHAHSWIRKQGELSSQAEEEQYAREAENLHRRAEGRPEGSR